MTEIEPCPCGRVLRFDRVTKNGSMKDVIYCNEAYYSPNSKPSHKIYYVGGNEYPEDIRISKEQFEKWVTQKYNLQFRRG